VVVLGASGCPFTGLASAMNVWGGLLPSLKNGGKNGVNPPAIGSGLSFDRNV